MLLNDTERAVFALRELYASRGYRPYKMSRFEEYALYARNKEFLSSEQIITFPARDGRLLALKPDVTLSIVKNGPRKPGAVEKVYYSESVYRSDAGGVMRELTQTGLECVGDLQSYDIAEVVLLAVRSLQLMGKRYILDISHMGLIGGILDPIPEPLREQATECLQQKNIHGLKGLDIPGKEKLIALIENAGPAAQVLPSLSAILDSDEEKLALGELCRIVAILEDQGLGDSLRVDFSLIGGMAYYNGIVFRGYLEGIPERVLSGGQYDRLASGMGRNNRAIGFAVYVDLLEQLQKDTQADVDAVLLISGEEDGLLIQRVAEELGKQGSVRLCSSLPEDCCPRKVYQFVSGKAVKWDGND